jgi:hypothetical protein
MFGIPFLNICTSLLAHNSKKLQRCNLNRFIHYANDLFVSR